MSLMTLLLAAITAYVLVGLLFVASAVVMAGRSPHPRPVAVLAHSTTRPRT
jgi:hypothetical protein